MEKSESEVLKGKELTPYGIIFPEGVWIWEAMRLLVQKEVDQGRPAPTKQEAAQRLIYSLLNTLELKLFTIDGFDGEELPVERSYLRSSRAIPDFLRGFVPYDGDYSGARSNGRFIYIDRSQYKNFLADKSIGEKADGSSDPLKKPTYVPPYMQFMQKAVKELDLSADKRMNKSEIIHWLESNWPSDLGGRSKSLIEYMATILRQPEHKKGGNTAWGSD